MRQAACLLPLAAGLLLVCSHTTAFLSPCSSLPRVQVCRDAGRLALRMSDSKSRTDLTRRSFVGVAPAALLALTLKPNEATAFTAPASVAIGGPPSSPQEVSGYLQHAVITCKDIDDEVEFWTKGLGMKKLRARGSDTVFVGYGPESLKVNGGHFVLELVEEAKKGPKLDIGTGFQRFELELPQTVNQVLDIEAAGGRLVPRWFGTSNFFEAMSPSGYTARVTPIKQPKVDYPFKAVVLRSKDMKASKDFFGSLGMSQKQGFSLPFLGDGTETLRFTSKDGQPMGAAVVLEPLPEDVKNVTVGNGFKLAVLTQDTKSAADKVVADTKAKVLFQGTVPKVGTKVAALQEPANGYTVVLVDYTDFEKELPLPPPSPPPAPKEAAAPATAPSGPATTEAAQPAATAAAGAVPEKKKKKPRLFEAPAPAAPEASKSQ